MDENVNRDVDRHVGSRVRMRRLMLKMSQEALGGALGITFQQVQKYEKGVNRISASRLQHIAQLFRVPVPFFFEGIPGGNEGDAHLPKHVNEFMATAEGLAFAEAFTRIRNTRLRQTIAAFVEDVADHKAEPH